MHEQIWKGISDFNFSCREFAKEPDMVLEARQRLIEEAGTNKLDSTKAEELVKEMLYERFEDPKDDGTVLAMACIPCPSGYGTHRIKATGLAAGIRTPHAAPAQQITGESSAPVLRGLTARNAGAKKKSQTQKDFQTAWDKVADNHYLHACVARPVRKDEIAREVDAQRAERKEWDNLRIKQVWDPTKVREFNEVARTARRDTRKSI